MCLFIDLALVKFNFGVKMFEEIWQLLNLTSGIEDSGLEILYMPLAGLGHLVWLGKVRLHYI